VLIGLKVEVATTSPDLDVRLWRANRPAGRPLSHGRDGVAAVGPLTPPRRVLAGGAKSDREALDAVLRAEGDSSATGAIEITKSRSLGLVFELTSRPRSGLLAVWARGEGKLTVIGIGPHARPLTVTGPRLNRAYQILAVDVAPFLGSIIQGGPLRLCVSGRALIDRVALDIGEPMPVARAPIERLSPPSGPVRLEPGKLTVLTFADPHPQRGISMLVLEISRASSGP
jgi:hypothetical protein